MKKYLPPIIVLFILTAFSSYAQNPTFYGVATLGGQFNVGTIFQTDNTGSTFNVDFSFYGQNALPAGNVIQATNGLLYGMSMGAGLNGVGNIFSYNTLTGVETDVYDFGGSVDGRHPQGSLLQVTDSLLYGMTAGGGNNTDDGIIFSYNIKTGVETILHSFGNGTDGKNPDGSLIQLNDSLLYGMTESGGNDNLGTIFSYNIISGAETDVHDFDGSLTDGASPTGSLLLASNGLLYGMTQSGGFSDAGIIFSFNTVKDTEIDVHDFDVVNGEIPLGTLIQVKDSLLYGLTEFDGIKTSGIIFSYNISKDTLITLHRFGLGSDGLKPNGSLIQANDSLLYGVTTSGGPGNINGNGVIFSYNIAKDTEIVVHSFSVTDGRQPYGSLLQATNGLLYGFTFGGGPAGDGVLYSFNDTTDKETIATNLSICDDGNQPNGSLIKASNGLFYGLTQYGGANNKGSIFSYNSSTGRETPLYDFGNGTDGQNPYASLLQINDSIFYGTTSYGGLNGYGIIFKFNSLSGKETDVLDFSANNGGLYPYCSLIKASNGLLYGTTLSTIFSYDISKNSITDLHDFGNGTDGQYSFGSLIEVNDSLLFGLTDMGGTGGDGTIFNYNILTGVETVVSNFNGVPDGNGPDGSLLLANNGLLYGMTYAGGTHDEGTIFSYNITKGTRSMILSFDGVNGQNPAADFIQARNGLLYATTTHGGTDNDGTIISYDIATNTESVLHNFTGIDGQNPYCDLLDIDTTTLVINRLTSGNTPLLMYPNPTSGVFTIKLNGNQNGSLLEIYNIMGEKIYQSVLTDAQSAMNLSFRPAGVYFVYLTSYNGTEIGKVLITK